MDRFLLFIRSEVLYVTNEEAVFILEITSLLICNLASRFNPEGKNDFFCLDEFYRRSSRDTYADLFPNRLQNKAKRGRTYFKTSNV